MFSCDKMYSFHIQNYEKVWYCYIKRDDDLDILIINDYTKTMKLQRPFGKGFVINSTIKLDFLQ